MSSARARFAQLLLVATAGSQAGHLVAYQARFGASAAAVQAGGVHSYFLPLAATLLGGAGATGLLALLAIGAARLAAGRRRPIRERWALMEVLPALFALQLAIYIGQESIEAAVTGGTGTAALDLLLWGALGQLPVAFLGALALAWISVRFERALGQLRFLLAVPARPDAAGRYLVVPPNPVARLRPALVWRAGFTRRGPPPAS